MTTPKIAKALSNLDDELIAAAAEEKAAPRLLTKKKVLALLAACLLLVGTFAMMGMNEEVIINYNQKEDFLRLAEYHAERGESEWAEYYLDWSDVEIGKPFPAEWLNKDGTFKDFVTLEMINEKFHGSLHEQFILDAPADETGHIVAEAFYVQDSTGNFSLHTNVCHISNVATYSSHEQEVIENARDF